MPKGYEKHVGARSELIACAWLIEQGYEVFRNVSQHGLADVVALKGGLIIKIDIKTWGDTREAARPRLKESQMAEGIKALYVFPDGSCKLDLEPSYLRQRETRQCMQCTGTFRATKNQRYCTVSCRPSANGSERYLITCSSSLGIR